MIEKYFAETDVLKTYVPLQYQEKFIGKKKRRKIVESVICPRYVFVKCTENLRYKIMCRHESLFIQYFLKDKSRTQKGTNFADFAIIPDAQMEVFRRMVESKYQVIVEPSLYKRGAQVRVIDGVLNGVEGVLENDADGVDMVCVKIEQLGYASVKIEKDKIEVIQK